MVEKTEKTEKNRRFDSLPPTTPHMFSNCVDYWNKIWEGKFVSSLFHPKKRESRLVREKILLFKTYRQWWRRAFRRGEARGGSGSILRFRSSAAEIFSPLLDVSKTEGRNGPHREARGPGRSWVLFVLRLWFRLRLRFWLHLRLRGFFGRRLPQLVFQALQVFGDAAMWQSHLRWS